MYIKARKKLLRKALETQNSKPVAIMPKMVPVKVEVVKPVIVEPVSEKLRGYKVKQVSPYKIDNCAPSVLF